MKLGLMISSLRMGLEDSIRKASELGVKGIQVLVQGAELGPDMPRAEVDRILKLIEDCGLEISAVCGDIGGFADPALSEDRIAKTIGMLEFTNSIGVGIMTTHIGVIPEVTSSPSWKLIRDSVRKVALAAERLKVRFATETGPEHPAVLKGLLDSVGSEYVAVNYDPANLVMQGYDPVGGVYLLKEYIVHTHAKDGRITAAGKHEETLIGEGHVWFPKYLEALKNMGYDGYITIEREVGENRLEDITREISYLRSLGVE